MTWGLNISDSRLRPPVGSTEERITLRQFQENPQNFKEFKEAVATRFGVENLASRTLWVTAFGLLGDAFSIAGFALARWRRWGNVASFILPILFDEAGSALASTALNRPGGLTGENYGKELYEGVIQRGILQSAW